MADIDNGFKQSLKTAFGTPTPAPQPQAAPVQPQGPSLWQVLMSKLQSPKDPYQNMARVLTEKK